MRSLCVIVACAACSTAVPAAPDSFADDSAQAAVRFLSSLPHEQAALAAFAFADGERLNWHYIPRARRGIPLGGLGTTSRHLAYGLLATALGRRGFLEATAIMALEDVLRSRGGPFVRDSGAYHLSVFGEPSTHATWGWRLEGHHVSINVTFVDGVRAVAGPTFLGAAPTPAPPGLLGHARILGREEDLGFALVQSLTPALRATAIYTTTPPEDIVTGPGGTFDELPGLAAKRMPRAQRMQLFALLAEVLEHVPREIALRERARLVGDGLDDVVFTWAGGVVRGEPHYFRISGPTFLYELDNTQEGASHVHTIWHDRLAGDFGLSVRERLGDHLGRGHGSAAGYASIPPAQEYCAPVTKLAAFDARKPITFATSCGDP